MADNSAPHIEQMIPKDLLGLAEVQARHEEELLAKPRFRDRRHGDAGSRNRRNCGDLQRRQRCPPGATSLS